MKKKKERNEFFWKGGLNKKKRNNLKFPHFSICHRFLISTDEFFCSWSSLDSVRGHRTHQFWIFFLILKLWVTICASFLGQSRFFKSNVLIPDFLKTVRIYQFQKNKSGHPTLILSLSLNSVNKLRCLISQHYHFSLSLLLNSHHLSLPRLDWELMR